MAAVFVAMVVVAGAGFGVASSLAAYAQRNWRNRAEGGETVLVEA
ncbi:hypothetical protein [Actinomycetospora sp. TBRC 11914]|nr:hypothetical protein [Actinomycetospora sp. TBRC 11914]